MTAPQWDWLRNAAEAPEITLEVYDDLPENICRTIEIVDGSAVRCQSPGPAHQGIQHNLVAALRESAKSVDSAEGTCHKVVGDLDVLLSEVPLNIRRPDVVVYRCVRDDRGRWGRKPYASDCILVIEIVSPNTVTADLRDKKAEYAAAGIPNYWIVRMTRDDGPVMTVDRYRIGMSGEYTAAGCTLRGKQLRAIEAADPLPVTVSWEQLDEGV